MEDRYQLSHEVVVPRGGDLPRLEAELVLSVLALGLYRPCSRRVRRGSCSVDELVNLFLCRFSPDTTKEREKKAAALEQDIQLKLGNVPSLDEDYIIRRFLALIKATVRTNYFQQQVQSNYSQPLAFKLDSMAIPDMPLPAPLCEIFVYSPGFEGIHLRKARVSRGGIRWSERPKIFELKF